MKTIIERGASWTLEETKLLLSLWGQDLVQRKATNLKRTKEVYEKISENFSQNGFERTPDQVRTRVFNMIAEYRRILKALATDPERRKKCVFFEPLHRIYEAQHMDDVKSALDDYEPTEHPFSPASHTISEDTRGDESISDGEADGNTTDAGTNNATSTKSTAASKSSSGNNNNNSDNNNSSTADQNGDSNNNNNNNSSSAASNNSDGGSVEAQSAKKIKLDPTTTQLAQSKAGQTYSATNNNSSQNNSTNSTSNPNDQPATPAAPTTPNSKQNKPMPASTSGAGTSSSSTSGSGAGAGVPPSTPTQQLQQQQRHQSLLLPHGAATSSSASGSSTPINKLMASGSNNTPSYININSTTKLPVIRANQLLGHSTNGNEPLNLNGTATAARLPPTAAITSHQLYQAPVNTFDVTSSALLIDRMFAHLSRESENMREWIGLEKERMAMERARRQQDAEREAKRDRLLLDTLMKYQEQWLNFMRTIDPRFLEDLPEQPPRLKINADSTPTTSSIIKDYTGNTNTTTTTTTTTSAAGHLSEGGDVPTFQASSTNQTPASNATGTQTTITTNITTKEGPISNAPEAAVE